MKLKEILELIGGTLFGDGETEISGISSLKDAKEGDITFLFRKSYVNLAKETKASALVVGEDIEIKELGERNILITPDPFKAYVKVAYLFAKEEEKEAFVSPLAYVSDGVTMGEGVRIHPFVYIGRGSRIGRFTTIHPFVYLGKDVSIGENSIIYPNCTIYDGVTIGNRVIIHSGSVIGSDGFGYFWDGKRHVKIPQLGTVEIGDDVEIGANVTIDRASLGKTLVKKGTKIDNLVQIGHNVTVGEDSIIVAQVGIGGSSEVGNRVIIAGQVGIRDHVRIGDDVKIGGQSGVTKDVPDGSEVTGTPHMAHREWSRLQAYLKRLPELFSKVKKMEEKIKLGEDR